MKKYICLIAVICLLATVLSSCALFDTGDRFVGGELLDDEMMIDIWMEIFSSEPEHPEFFPESVESQSEEIEINHENEPVAKTVYWTKSGSVWHTHRDCGNLKNSPEILSGSVSEASEAGKSKLCFNCEKKDKP